MLTDLADIATRAAKGDGRGGRRPGAGRKNKQGTNVGAKEIKLDVEVRTPEDILQNGLPPPLLGDSDGNGVNGNDMGAIDFTMPNDPVALYAGAKARKEAAHAAKAELEFRIKAGMYLPREAVRAAIATAFQATAQGLRSIPDNLERKLGIAPEISEAVSTLIDEAMGDLSAELENIFTENNAISTEG